MPLLRASVPSSSKQRNPSAVAGKGFFFVVPQTKLEPGPAEIVCDSNTVATRSSGEFIPRTRRATRSYFFFFATLRVFFAVFFTALFAFFAFLAFLAMLPS